MCEQHAKHNRHSEKRISLNQSAGQKSLAGESKSAAAFCCSLFSAFSLFSQFDSLIYISAFCHRFPLFFQTFVQDNKNRTREPKYKKTAEFLKKVGSRMKEVRAIITREKNSNRESASLCGTIHSLSGRSVFLEVKASS